MRCCCTKAPAQYISTTDRRVPIALSPCGSWRRLDVLTDSSIILIGVTHIIACHKVHVTELLEDSMLQRHMIPRAILEQYARTQADECLYVWQLCGSRRYERDERVCLETCSSTPQHGPVVWSKLQRRVPEAIDIDG